MTDKEICAYCLTSEHPIDVKGYRFAASGAEVAYLICHSCCTVLRRLHFNDEPNKMREFWNKVWANLSLDECIEPIESSASEAKQVVIEEESVVLVDLPI